MKTKWPKEVPILSASHMYKEDIDGPGRTHCLAGWTGPARIGSFDETHPALIRAINETGFDGSRKGVGSFAEHDDVSKELMARVWNRAMYLLGYTVGNPEKKTLPKVF